jgi:uncharacterized membrane protein
MASATDPSRSEPGDAGRGDAAARFAMPPRFSTILLTDRKTSIVLPRHWHLITMNSACDYINFRQILISGLLFFAALLLTIAALHKHMEANHRTAILIDFYPVERNERGEYRFTRPQSHILIPPMSGQAAVLSLQTYSPDPLPKRPLVLRLEGRLLATLTSDNIPRRLTLVLSPAGTGAGQLLTLETTPAHAPGDPRLLGIFTDNVTLRSPHPWFQTHLWLIAAAPAIALSILGMARCGLIARFCGSVIVAVAGWWGWAIAWGMVIGIGAALTFDWIIGRSYGALWLRRIDNTISRLTYPDIIIGSFTLAWIGIVGWSSIVLHERFATGAYDLGLFDQWLWLISRGLPAYSTGIGVHMLGDHAAVLLYPLAMLYLIVADVRVLLIVQSLAVGVGGLMLYRLGYIRGSPWIGVLVAGAYLIHPSTHNMTLFHFHPDTLAATAILVALSGIEQRKPLIIALAAIVVCAAKENFTLTVGWLGAWLLICGQQRWGIALLLGSLAWFGVATFLIQPAFNGQPASVFVIRFDRYGDTPFEIIMTILQQPHRVALDMLQPENLHYLVLVLAPFGMLPLLSPARAALALPALSLNMLSNFDPQRELLFHYSALPVALLAYASLESITTLQRWMKSQHTSLIVSAFCLTLGAMWTISVTPLRLSGALQPSRHEVEQSLIRHYVLRQIPDDAPVAASQAIHPHLTHREQAFVFPNPFIPVNYVNPTGAPQPPSVEFIVHDIHGMGTSTANRERELLRELERRQLFFPVARFGTIMLMKRTAKPLPDFCFGHGWQDTLCRIE